MPRFVERDRGVDAEQFSDRDTEQHERLGAVQHGEADESEGVWWIDNSVGIQPVRDGDWVVTDDLGKAKVYSPAEFADRFEPAPIGK